MNKLTTLFLLLGLFALAGIVVWQLNHEEEQRVVVEQRLFEDLVAERVVGMRLDNSERALNIRFEKREGGEWWIIDPIDYPADLGVMTLLLGVLERNLLLPPVQAEPDPASLGLAQPRALFEVEELVDGELRVHRLELGALDLDDLHVYVRTEQGIGRTLRNLDNTFNRNLNDWRSIRAFQIRSDDIYELHRTGSFQEGPESEPRDLSFHAYDDGGTWRSVLPRKASLDERVVSILQYGAGALHVERFIEDDPVTVEPYGLDRPEFTVSVKTGSAEPILLFGRRAVGAQWYMMLQGGRSVWTISEDDMVRLTLAFESFLDRRLLKVPRAAVRGLRLDREDSALLLERNERGAWKVYELAGGERDKGYTADAGVVGELLSRLEQLELAQLLTEEEAAAVEWTRGFELQAEEGGYTARLGRQLKLASGATGVPFRREGEELVFLVDPWLGTFVDSDSVELSNRQLVQLDEVYVTALQLTDGDRQRRYVRSERGIWTEEGSDVEATQLTRVLDALLFLRVGARQVARDGKPLEDELRVRFELRDGSAREYGVGVATGVDGKAGEACDVDGQRGFLKVKGLLARLQELVYR